MCQNQNQDQDQINIRLEEEKDYYEVENLTREAFWNVYRPGCFEHFIVHNIRKDSSFIKELDYIIEKDGKIIANIIYAKGILKLKKRKNIEDIKGDNNNKEEENEEKEKVKEEKEEEEEEEKEVLIFGPVSVLPEYQKQGYGEKLIRYSMKKAKELGYQEILITGNPDYYKKFGFESAFHYRIIYEGMNENEELPFFMICILNKEKFNQTFYNNNKNEEKDIIYIYSDPKCYKVNEKELEEFDKKFPKKIKEKRKGQLE
ncbi:acyl-CoA N-acyltransferase [Anaeromyces robustus]|uniref:Acyl-CoA N-acyltransferase n=1 Tax=Anaeromyces robustus TaxID=1754192 RepID=A0A1Y1XQB7_9FUNG|nr:acyl-CoA N-acyltransferase [Anaeromyces robustus]|eukprot:ORX87706.1 acyl-CoA N-acyltransferase [Anaeromyces robustus]